MAVSKRLRYEILRRDNHACRYCGAHAPDVELAVDHVVPIALGGTDEPTNLVTACRPCNAGKSASAPDAPIVDDVAADALRWARAMTVAADNQRAAWQAEAHLLAEFADIWHGWEAPDGRPFHPLEDEHYETLRNLLKAGLTLGDLGYAADQAMRAGHIPKGRLWRYFAGICWRIVAERREIAASLIQAQEAPTDGT
jgi:hypothetical protein